MLALCLGALPLIVYNLAADEKFSTIRSNVHLASPEFKSKFDMLRLTWRGSILFGYLVNQDSASQPRSPQTLLEKASFKVRSLAGEHSDNKLEPAFIVALVLIPLLWRTRARNALLFCAIAISVAWVLMALAGGGGYAHHTVLLWPLPYLLLAVVFAEASRHLGQFGKWALIAGLSFLVVSNLLVTNQYLYQMIRNGAAGSWTDAIYALSDGLLKKPASQVVLPDWGMLDSLAVLGQGKLPLRIAVDPFLPPDTPPARKQEVFSDGAAIWVEHTSGNETFKDVNEHVLAAARRAGFEPVPLGTYCDRNGRTIFQTLRFTLQR
jgi:hypothetical protein